MPRSIQLTASVAKGSTATPMMTKSDGSESPFVIPKKKAFVVTDISIQRLSVLGMTDLFEVSLSQNIPTGGTTNRWTFIGKIAQNLERAFTSGIRFSTPFIVANGSQSADLVVVRLWGFFA